MPCECLLGGIGVCLCAKYRGRGRGGEGLTAAEGPRQLSVRGAVLYGTLVPGEGGEADGVRVCGHAVTVIRGEMFFPDE